MDKPIQGITLIKVNEHCCLEAYQDQRGIWSIGWGRIKDVKEGDTCTQEQADVWLDEDTDWAWKAICDLVNVPMTPNQAGALLSFVYNLGEPQFKHSTLLGRLNQGDYTNVPFLMQQWVWVTLPDGTRTKSAGLIVRRSREAALWNQT